MISKTERFEMRLDVELLERVDNWRGDQADVPSRAEAVRRLVQTALAPSSKTSVKFSDGEKLLLLMMGNMFKHLKVKQPDPDPDFIAAMIFGGHHWAARWALAGVFHDHEDDPTNVRFVVDVLDMWTFLERGYEKLSAADKELVDKEASPFGENVQFSGFDGNNESEHLGIANFLVDELERFTRFAKRDLNSHFPTLDRYTSMLRAFRPIREKLIGRELSASQIAMLLLTR